MLMDRTCFVLPSGSSRLKDSLGGSKGDDAAHRVAMLSTTAPALLNSIILALFLPLATALDCAPRPYVAPLFSQYLVFSNSAQLLQGSHLLRMHLLFQSCKLPSLAPGHTGLEFLLQHFNILQHWAWILWLLECCRQCGCVHTCASGCSHYLHGDPQHS